MTIKRFAVLLVKYGLLLAALVLAAALSALTTMRVVLTSQDVVVPSLLRKRIPEAGAIASRHGLLIRVEGKRNDAEVPPDRIVAQDPPPDSTLKSNRSIRVWISLGPRRLVVPPVEGGSLRTGRLALEQAQASVGHVAEVDDVAEEGTILVQHPVAGESGGLENGVSLLVSRGPGKGTTYLMPDLIGRRAEEALEGLRRAGLKVAEVRYRSYPGVAPGIVLRQLPAAGHRVSPRQSISLDISKDVP